MLRITWKENKWYIVNRTGWPWFTHYTYKLEAFGKLFHFDDHELKTRLNEFLFFRYKSTKSFLWKSIKQAGVQHLDQVKWQFPHTSQNVNANGHLNVYL